MIGKFVTAISEYDKAWAALFRRRCNECFGSGEVDRQRKPSGVRRVGVEVPDRVPCPECGGSGFKKLSNQ